MPSRVIAPASLIPVTVALVLAGIACSFSKPEGSGESAATTTETSGGPTDGTVETTSTTSDTADLTTAGATIQTESSSSSETESSATTEATETDSTETDSTETASTETDEFCGECENQVEGLACKDCKYDFSAVPQWYCAGECSPTSPAPPGINCTQEDADAFCQVLLRDPDAFAKTWADGFIEPLGGFCCLQFADDTAVILGPLDDLGIEQLCYQPTDLTVNHGVGIGLLAEKVECSV